MLSNEELREIYDERYAGSSSAHLERERVIYHRYFEVLLAWDRQRNSRVSYLDLGCGLGAKTCGFKREFHRSVAVDLSERAIEICKAQFSQEGIDWRAGNAMDIEGKFDLITAFGFSLFNTADIEEYLSNVGQIITQNLSEKGGVMLIGSFTDFSGNEGTWYQHTKQDLVQICDGLRENYNVRVEIVFPQKKWKNYVGSGFLHFFAELRKFFLKRTRIFFIKIEHG